MRTDTVSKLLVFAAAVIGVVVAALILFGTDKVGALYAIAWVLIVLVVYLASLLVP